MLIGRALAQRSQRQQQKEEKAGAHLFSVPQVDQLVSGFWGGKGMRSRISGGSFSCTCRAFCLAAPISITGTGVVRATMIHTTLEKRNPASAINSSISACRGQ